MALNDTIIRNLKPEGRKRELLVADVGGLYLRLRVGAGKTTKTWQFRRRGDGVTHIKTLGTYPALSLKEARLKAAELALKRAEAKGPTVAEAGAQWYDEIISKAHKDASKVRRYLDLAEGELGSMRVADVEPRHIAKVVRDYRDRAAKNARATAGGRTVARHLLATLKGVFDYCVATGWLSTSPAAPIKGAVVGEPDRARERVLTDDEIRWVMTSDMPQAAVWRFLLATGLRIGEAYGGHRAGADWRVPATVSKNGKLHVVHLSPLALAQLEAQPWPPRWSVQGALSMQRKGWSCHDLRRSFATRLNEIGILPHIVERMLNHALPGIMATYNRASYDLERREALEMWSDRLTALVAPPSADVVVPLRKAAAA